MTVDDLKMSMEKFWQVFDEQLELIDQVLASRGTPVSRRPWEAAFLFLEHCILAIRGVPVVELTSHSTVLYAPVREHSRKPEEFYRLVESLCPSPSRIDLFAREQRDGWTCAGAEAGKFSAMQ